MSDKRKDDAGVLGSLPATRPTGLRAERSRDAGQRAAKPKPKAAGKSRAVKKTTTEPAPATPSAPAAEPTVPHRPRPVRAGAPALAESTERARSETHEPLEPGAAPPSGTELVTTAVQAAGELAQIGLKLSGRALKRAVERLPKP
jgi:hypothetical protein